jgi:hypothetical protein
MFGNNRPFALRYIRVASRRPQYDLSDPPERYTWGVLQDKNPSLSNTVTTWEDRARSALWRMRDRERQ